MKLNLQNIEDIVFYDKKIQNLFPELRYYFDQWSLSKRVPGMQPLGKRTLIDFLNILNKEHLLKLEEYFGEIIILEKIDYHIVKDYQFDINAENNLCEFSDYKDFCIARTGNHIDVLFWK